MIHYTLTCEKAHAFDGWFRSSEDYARQEEKGLLSCPVCGSGKVGKGLMAPNVATSAEETPAGGQVLLGEREAHLRRLLKEVRDEVTRNAENVGPRFAEVARQMHDGEIEKSSVYGIASKDEVQALKEDGVEFHPLPNIPDESN